MIRRVLLILFLLTVISLPVSADTVKWVNFDVPYESLHYAMMQDIDSYEKDRHISWIDGLSVAACRTGGKCRLSSVKKAFQEMKTGKSPEELLGNLYQYYDYYHTAYTAVLGGMLGTYCIEKGGEEKVVYGLKAFSPIASGYGYSHCADFGNSRSFGFARKHLGNDIMGSLGTPIVAVEGGVVEVMGWNRYGGWRIGIRSFDSKRYYYYAHLQKDHPFAKDLKEGDVVQAGDLLGFMGRTGYSDQENVNNITKVHLHFGIQLVFDESQKECTSEIWIDVYDLVRLLSSHRSSLERTQEGWKRVYAYRDMDISEFPKKTESFLR